MLEEKVDITLSKKYSDREIIKRTLIYIKPVKWKFILGAALVLLNVLLGLVLPYLYGVYVDKVNDANGMASFATIAAVCGGYILTIAVNMAITYLSTVILQNAGQQVIFTLRQEVFEKIESFSHEQLANIPVGRLVTRVTNDINALNELYTSVLVKLVKYSLTMIGIIVVMVFINPILSLFMLGILVIIVIATIVYRHYATRAFREVRKQVSNLNTFLSENISGMKIIQIFNQEKRKEDEFDVTNKKMLRARKNVMYVFAFYRPTISFLQYLAIAIVFFFGFKDILAAKVYFGIAFTFGRLLSYYTYTQQFFEPIQQIAEQFDRLQSGIVASERIFNILDMESTIKEKEEPIKVDSFKGKIEFKNVWFAYENDEWILQDVSFIINPGETVAFVGATGAGKSTILSLIGRYYDVQKGQILIDDIDIKDMNISSLRSKIGLMLQDVFLFSGTIKDNITLHNEEIPEEEIKYAVKYVNADSFIDKLEDGLDTEVTEKGNNFSAGQRQLISFARTMVSKPQILVLDEATANIDTETEVIIQNSLNKMKTIGTMIVVAHRLSTIQHADNIICLSHGKIVEQGNHQNLLKNKGYYYKLYKLQFEER